MEDLVGQTARAICALLSAAQLPDFWSNEGPTSRAVTLGDRNGVPLAPDARALLLVAWDLWEGSLSKSNGGDLALAELLRELDADQLRLLSSLLQALNAGPPAVERWLAASEHRSGRGSE